MAKYQVILADPEFEKVIRREDVRLVSSSSSGCFQQASLGRISGLSRGRYFKNHRKHSEREELIRFHLPIQETTNHYTKERNTQMTIRKIQKFFAGVLTVSVLTASVFGGSALASETETTSETAAEASF